MSLANSSPDCNVLSLPGVVNVDSFTKLGQVVEGSVRPVDLERLDEYLFSDDGEIRYRISGSVVTGPDGSRQRHARCTITGWLTLECQATLEGLRHDIRTDSMLILVGSESELPPLEEESEEEDFIVAPNEFDLTALIEDEIILNLPMFPRAEDAPDASPGEVEGGADEKSPFAALAALRKPN